MKKVLIFTMAFVFITQLSLAQETRFQLSSHILDITSGKPAADVKITLSKMKGKDNWVMEAEKTTDSNGRIKDFLAQDGRDNSGIYKLTFYTEPYFSSLGEKSFYPFIEVVFEITGDEHYHVPITLSPCGYSTYRGS